MRDQEKCAARYGGRGQRLWPPFEKNDKADRSFGDIYKHFFPIFISILALAVSGYQAFIANDSKERSLRAYIGAHEVGYQGIDGDQPIGFAFSFLNHGQTPAHDFSFEGAIDLLPYPLPENYPIPAPASRPTQRGSIFSNETNPLIGWVWERSPISHDEKLEILGPNPSYEIYMHGTATYSDIFNHVWHTNFCFFLNPTSIVREKNGDFHRNKNGSIEFQVAPCAIWNEIF